MTARARIETAAVARAPAPAPALALALACACASVFTGCETTTTGTSDGRPMPPPSRQVTQAPPNAPINAMSVLFAPKPSDSDANGRPDRVVAEMYLFARPFPMPTWRDGKVVITAFRMGKAGTPENPGKEPFHVWTIQTQDLDLGRFRSLVGEGYKFQISLLDDGGSDLVPGDALDFVSRFEPTAGGVVWGDGVRTISFQGAENSYPR
ncbi:MAG: hypothetical protein JNK53_00905 [Phycisphaerae bacterium]|nr:hypothetical protein [Phycisphaerae bacterium]